MRDTNFQPEKKINKHFETKESFIIGQACVVTVRLSFSFLPNVRKHFKIHSKYNKLFRERFFSVSVKTRKRFRLHWFASALSANVMMEQATHLSVLLWTGLDQYAGPALTSAVVG